MSNSCNLVTRVSIGGINYMVVDNATIDAQVDAGNYNIVTTRVTDMSNQFKG